MIQMAPQLSEADLKRRRFKNIALALLLFALVVLFYFLTLVRMGAPA